MKTDRQLAKYLANLGYGSRKEMEAAIRSGRVTGSGDNLRFDDEPLDPAPGMVLMMNKPAGFTCSRADQGDWSMNYCPPASCNAAPHFRQSGDWTPTQPGFSCSLMTANCCTD